MNICATVIFYNPTNDVLENIASFINGVNHLIIVDNSETPNDAINQKLQNSYNKITLIENRKNLGIATALNIACHKAIELKYDWILTMDQDSRFINFSDYLKCLEKFYHQQDLALLAANTQWHAKKYLSKNPTCNYEERTLVITSGNFLNLSLFNEIGRFEDELFIDKVDYDYCLKASCLGYKIYYFKDIMIEHSLGNLFQRRNPFTKKIRNKIEHSPQRAYHITRNYMYTWKKYSKKFPKEFNLLRTLNILFVHEVTKILIYEDQKLKKLYAKLMGLFHFIINKYGKYEL